MNSKAAGEQLKTTPRAQNSNVRRVSSVYNNTSKSKQRQKPTGLNMRTIGLPENQKWLAIKQICSKERLSASDAFLKSASRGGVHDSIHSPKDITITPQRSSNNFNSQNPILSGSTFAMYSRTLQTTGAVQGSATGSDIHGHNNILHTKVEGRSRLAAGLKQRKQVDLNDAVLKIHSPSQPIASIQPNQNFHVLLLGNSNLLTAHNKTIGQSNSSRHQLRRQANSSTLSDKSGDNNAILKPMIHFAAPIRPEVPCLPMNGHLNTTLTEETQQSNGCLENTLYKNQRGSTQQTKLLMSDKANTLRLNDTEQSMVSRKYRQYNITPNRLDSQSNNLRQVKVSAAQQTASSNGLEEEKGFTSFNSTLRKNTLLRRNMVDSGTSPIDSDLLKRKSLERRYTTNIDVAAVYKPNDLNTRERMEPNLTSRTLDNQRDEVKNQTIDQKRNGQHQLQRPAVEKKSHKPAVVQVKFDQDVKTFPSAPQDGIISPYRQSQEVKKFVGSPVASPIQRPRPMPILSPSNMLKDQFKPILQQDLDPSPITNASRKHKRKSVNSPASYEDRTALLAPRNEECVGGLTESRQSPVSPDHQISCKLLPIEAMEKGSQPTIRTNERKASITGSSATATLKASKSTNNTQTILNFKQIKQRQITLEARVGVGGIGSHNVFNLTYQKQHARAAEKITLHTKNKQATGVQPRRSYDQPVQTSQRTSLEPSPLSFVQQNNAEDGELPKPGAGCQDDNQNSSANSSNHQERLCSLHSPLSKDENAAAETNPPGTGNEDELFYKQIALGMIDQESKIVVVCNDSLSSAMCTLAQRQQQQDSPVQRRTGPTSDQRRKTCRTSNNVLQFPTKAKHYRGNPINNDERRKLRSRNRFTNSQGSKIDLYQTMPMSARVDSSSMKFAALKDSLIKPELNQITQAQRRSEVRSRPRHKVVNKHDSRQATLISFQKTSTAVNDQQCSSPSVLSRQTNTLSQVLGIRSRHQSPGDKAAQRQLLGGSYAGARVDKQSDRTYQSVMQNSIKQNVVSNTNETMASSITRAQAREFHTMRSRIKSQGAPRRRFVGQRQNLFNMMASGLRKKQQPMGSKEFGPTSQRTAAGSLSSQQIDDNKSAGETDRENPLTLEPMNTNRASNYHPSLCADGLTSSAEDIRNDTLVTGDEVTQQNTAREFIACEDQLADTVNENTNKSLLTVAKGAVEDPKLSDSTTPRYHPLNSMQLSSTVSDIVSRSKTFDSRSTQQQQNSQRMDLPHNMSVEQAVFMMSKALKSEHLSKHETYHRFHKKRGEAGRLCQTQRDCMGSPIVGSQLAGGVLGEQLPKKEDEMKDVRTSLDYAGMIITEPKFKTFCAQKTLADYARQRQSMRLKTAPYDRGLYIGKDREQRKQEYKMYQDQKEESLANTDEQYALIRNHVTRLKHRDNNHLKEMAREQQETQQQLIETVESNRKDRQISALQADLYLSQQPISSEKQGVSYQTLYQGQDLEILKDSNQESIKSEASQSHQAKKLFSVVRVQTQIEQFEPSESIENTAGQRMSTKLLSGGFTDSSQVVNKENASKTISQLGILELHQQQHDLTPMLGINSIALANNSQMQIITNGASGDCYSGSHATFIEQVMGDSLLDKFRNSGQDTTSLETARLPTEIDQIAAETQYFSEKNRQALSPQPIDRCSLLLAAKQKRGFITVRQDYLVHEQASSKALRSDSHGRTRSPHQQESTITGMVARSPVIPSNFRIQSQQASEESKVDRVSPQISLAIKPIPSRQFEFEEPPLMPPMLRLTSSSIGIMSQEMINPVPKLIQKGSLTRGYQKSRRYIKTPLKSTPLKHQQKSSKKQRMQTCRGEQQSISISGVKMFNADLSAMSGGGISQHYRTQHQQQQQQQQHIIEVLRLNEENIASRVGTLVANSADTRCSPVEQMILPTQPNAASPMACVTLHSAEMHSQGGLMVTMLQDVNSIASRQAIDYDDPISTEKKFVSTQDQKSSMLLRSRITINKSLTARNGIIAMKGSKTQKHSDSQKLYNGGKMLIEPDSTPRPANMNLAIIRISGSPERTANLTPVPDYDRKL